MHSQWCTGQLDRGMWGARGVSNKTLTQLQLTIVYKTLKLKAADWAIFSNDRAHAQGQNLC